MEKENDLNKSERAEAVKKFFPASISSPIGGIS
jgi:hypothetical protein